MDIEQLIDSWFDSEYEGFEQLTEMANIPTQKSGLDYCLYYSTEQHSAGPRIKVFNSIRCNQGKEIHITISAKPEVTRDTVKNIKYFRNRKDLGKIYEMITLYKDDLLLMWYKPECFIDTSDLQRSIVKWFQTGIKEEVDKYEDC